MPHRRRPYPSSRQANTPSRLRMVAAPGLRYSAHAFGLGIEPSRSVGRAARPGRAKPPLRFRLAPRPPRPLHGAVWCRSQRSLLRYIATAAEALDRGLVPPRGKCWPRHAGVVPLLWAFWQRLVAQSKLGGLLRIGEPLHATRRKRSISRGCLSRWRQAHAQPTYVQPNWEQRQRGRQPSIVGR